MDNIIFLQVRKYQMVDISVKENNLIYCIDTKEAYYDISNNKRIQIGCTIQLDSERDRLEIVTPLLDKLYIILESNKAYRFQSNNWVEITNKPEIFDILVPATELVPRTLTQDGLSISPTTLASQVYTNDGRQVQNIIDELVSENKKIVLFTETRHVIVERDGQKVFNIPFPIINYDLKKFPILVLVNNTLLASSEYAISIEQMILVDDYPMLHAGDLVTFIFHYNQTISTDGVDATSINNVRFFVGVTEPPDKMETDVWFDTAEQSVKQFDGVQWKIIVKNREFKINLEKASYNLKEKTSIVPINIAGFNKLTDIILIFENSVYIEEVEDYEISSDNTNIIKANNELWRGDEEETLFNFIVFKNVKGTPETSFIPKNAINTDEQADKSKVLSILGITEEQLQKIKQL